jgi:hypothetical protein
MSLYRQARGSSPRVLVVVGVVAVLVGGLAGFALGRSSAPDPSLADQVADLRERLAPAGEAIELTTTEYPQAVEGDRVVEPTEYQAAKSDVQRARDTVASAYADLEAVDPAAADRLRRAVAALGAGVARRASEGQVDRLARLARDALEPVLGH